MFTHILITLDGSSYSERVLGYAADLARPSTGRVTLFMVVPDKGAGSGSKREEECRTYLDGHAQALRDAGVAEVAVEVRGGDPAPAIVEAVREVNADLIAMSTQGVSATVDEGLGSVASKVLRAAPCPVFMVRVERPEPPRTLAEEEWQSEGGANVG